MGAVILVINLSLVSLPRKIGQPECWRSHSQLFLLKKMNPSVRGWTLVRSRGHCLRTEAIVLPPSETASDMTYASQLRLSPGTAFIWREPQVTLSPEAAHHPTSLHWVGHLGRFHPRLWDNWGLCCSFFTVQHLLLSSTAFTPSLVWVLSGLLLYSLHASLCLRTFFLGYQLRIVLYSS